MQLVSATLLLLLLSISIAFCGIHPLVGSQPHATEDDVRSRVYTAGRHRNIQAHACRARKRQRRWRHRFVFGLRLSESHHETVAPAATWLRRCSHPCGLSVFSTYLSPDVVLTGNGAAGPKAITRGKANVEAALCAIGVAYRRIDAVSRGPINHTHKTALIAAFTKTQVDLELGLPYNIPFQHTITFDSACNFARLFEFADIFRTLDSPATLWHGWMCASVAGLCVTHVPSFGNGFAHIPTLTPAGKCFLHWRDEPMWRKDDEAFQSLSVFLIQQESWMRLQ
jgi:hypothetical protein